VSLAVLPVAAALGDDHAAAASREVTCHDEAGKPATDYRHVGVHSIVVRALREIEEHC